jgi:hypothetical protein
MSEIPQRDDEAQTHREGGPEVDDELPPFSVLIELLEDVMAQLEGIDEAVVAHRRAAGDDHKVLELLQLTSARISQAWTAVAVARRGLKP